MTDAGVPARLAATGIVETYETAFNENDAATMNALFCEDATFVDFSGRLTVGREALRPAQEFVFADGGPLADITADYEVEHVSAPAQDLAVVHARQRTRGHQAGPDPMHAVLTLVIRRPEDGRWRILTGQNTPAGA